MTFQRDYVLRMIEMMGEFLCKLRDLVSREAQDLLLDQTCRHNCGISLKTAKSLSPESLVELMNPMALLLLSEYIYLDTQLLNTDEEEARQNKLLVLRLLGNLYEEEILCVERGPRMKELADELEEDLTADDYFLCARFFVAGERYADAEDALFLGLPMSEDETAYAAAGAELLRPLLQEPEQALILAGLPRDEVEQAIKDLEGWEKT